MTLLNSKPLVGYKHGDFVKYKYNTIVYNPKGLPMFRDVEQYGFLQGTNIMSGKVSIQPVGSVHHSKQMRVEAEKIMGKEKYDRNTTYTKTAPEGFQVDQPVFDVPEGTPTYAGGDIPLPRDKQVTAKLSPAQIKRGIKKAAKMTGRKYEVRYKKTKGLDADIQKQKDMIMGKFNG